jgi:hypothetical protein
VTTIVVTPTLVALVISIFDSPASNRGKEVVSDSETDPSERPEVLVMDCTVLHPGEVSSAIVPIGSNPNMWGGP